MSNAVPPSVTPPSPNEWPNTIRNVTGVTKDRQAIITSPLHGLTSADESITSVDFLLIGGMIQLNGLMGVVQTVIDANNFIVNINTSQFFTYTSGGYLNIVTGIPPIETVGFQTFNTPFQNIATTN